jgi:hypothetical protein
LVAVTRYVVVEETTVGTPVMMPVDALMLSWVGNVGETE